MRKYSKHLSGYQNNSNWRSFQNDLNQQRSKRPNARPNPRSIGRPNKRRIGRKICILASLTIFGVFGIKALIPNGMATSPTAAAQASLPHKELPKITNKQDVRELLVNQDFDNLTEKNLELLVNQQTLQIETSLDEDLQNYLLSKMDRKNSRDIGIVVMEADTGRILAMAGFDKTGNAGNPCLRSNFPAASIFKIVTAASAVDHCNYTADSTMHFNGYKHTLYKRQLTDKINKHTNTVSFKDAFAQSINPVFGKIGENRLGKSVLEKYADTFKFNEPLNFDLSLPPSHFKINDDPYDWAEMASGFNRDTTISPLHGAVMASAVLNGGRMVAPSLVDRISDDKGKVLYHGQPSWEQQAMSAKASTVLDQMMQTTIKSGTARKSFLGYQKDKILSQLQIGGKTGSMDNNTHEVRYDWFVGFANERHGQAKVVVAVMVAHEKFIGIRAGQYARMAITHYFSKLLAKAKDEQTIQKI
jgi:cell division protein FtsI/penicillin-binding protein 2